MGTRKTRLGIATLLCTFFPGLALGQEAVNYEVTFENAVHHEARIAVTFSEVPDGILEVRMSRSSPGRYALHEFAKNVYSVSAVDGQGRELPGALRLPVPPLAQRGNAGEASVY